MSDKTPSPQSVVVPLEDWQHVIGALKNAKARLPMGAAIGNVSDALSKVEHLQAAPAPSSLAGGERKVIARTLFERGRTSHDVATWDDATDEMKDWLLGHADAILAALSPEAPAREGGGGAVSEAELRDAITLILPLAKGYAAAHPVGSNQSYVDYVEGLIAITPRHEAPAEGAGEDFYAVGEFIGRQPVLCVHGSTDPNNLCPYCEGEKIWGGRNLRARSSAPEAREGSK